MDSMQFRQALNKAREHTLSGDLTRALNLYQRLLKIRPQASDVLLDYGSVAAQLGEAEAADRALAKAKELSPQNSPALLQIGHRYEAARQARKARDCFFASAAADPLAIDPRIRLALSFEKDQRFEDARQAAEACLVINPKDEQARYVSALLDRRINKLELAELNLRDLIASKPKHEYVRYAARYELAQILDQTNRFDEAIECLSEGKEIVRGLADPSMLLRQYDRVANTKVRVAREYPKTVLQTWRKSFPESLRETIPPFAFLGGHPRSGTTLLERVMGCHPSVCAIDEPFLGPIISGRGLERSGKIPVAFLNVIRRRYIKALTQELGTEVGGKFLLEKNPSPTDILPVLLRIFPELRIIVALRDPRDVVLSCYFQNIPLNIANANFLTFERLAKHYANLMDVWLSVREWKDVRWMETKYEDTVVDLEREGRRVTGFLGLVWNENQARFFDTKQKTQVHSPTYHDVTQPVYSRSVARWRNYEKYLEPILPALEPYCRAFGYS